MIEKCQVYAWGSNENGRLGLDDCLNRNEPTLITGLVERNIFVIRIFLDASGEHTFMLCNDDQILGFGKNTSGQLGMDDRNDRNTPETVMQLKNKKIVKIAVGGACTVIVERQSKPLYINTNVKIKK